MEGKGLNIENPLASLISQVFLYGLVFEDNTEELRSSLKCLPIVRQELARQASSGCKSLQTSQEWVSG